MTVVSKIQKMGRIAVPKVVRQLYNLEEGDIVGVAILWVKKKDGTLISFKPNYKVEE